jgi:acyl-[acyl-carrier-protein]-phospholipid O-acyltransferase/long-chain-fatty-acid--[acyl-carrier-protein] ligase
MLLLATRRFLPLFITQFLGAFNDNLLKNALVVLITYKLAVEAGENAQVLVTLAAGLFILPFFLFSALAGQLADKFERTMIVRWVKTLEIIIMLLASVGFILHNSWFLIAVLFAAGTHSTFFGPIKYTLLPQHLLADELLTGNAYIEAGTFLAILLGTICGGLMILDAYGIYSVSSMLITIAVLGYIACQFIPLAPAPDPGLTLNYNLIQETMRIIGYSRVNQRVFICIIAISWFWFVGAIFLAQFPTYVKNYLHAEASVVTLFLTLFSVGIGLGSFVCSKMLKGQVKATYVPLAALGITIFTIDLYLASNNNVFFDINGLLSYQRFTHIHASWRIMLDVFLIALYAGMYIVPLYAIVQRDSDPNYRARIIAANNVINAFFMIIAALSTLCMLGLHRTIPEVFLCVGLLNLLVAYYLYKSNLNR